LHTGYNVTGEATVGTKNFQRHNLNLPTNAGHTDAIVSHAADCPGTMRSMVNIIHRITVIVIEIISIDVIYVTISIIIHASLTVKFRRIGPHIGGQIRVGIVHTGINHRHHNLTTSLLDAPSFRRINIRIGRSACLAGIVHSPQLTKRRIIGNRLYAPDVVRLSIVNANRGPKSILSGCNSGAGR
jgi:hypothetical protein